MRLVTVPPARPVGAEQPLVDLHVATIDGLGRLPLRRAATTMCWTPGQRLGLVVQGGVLRLSANHPPHGAQPARIEVVLDRRCRVLLPYGFRMTTGLLPGLRLVVVVMGHEGVVAALPLSRLIDAMVGDR